MRLTHLYLPYQFDYQIHLIPGAKQYFSDLEFLICNTCINDNVLIGLTEIFKSVKECELYITDVNNYNIVKLIETIKELFSILLLSEVIGGLMNHFTEFLKIHYFNDVTKCECLKNLSLPFLQILKVRRAPIEVLASLIKNANGCLTKIKVDDICDETNNQILIQVIYQNCQNLKDLRLSCRNDDILELENLLVKCRYLIKLHIIDNEMLNWDYLFEVLIKSSPTCLFNFGFWFFEAPRLESLDLFFDKWKNKHIMLLKTIQIHICYPPVYVLNDEYFNLIEKYKLQGCY
ncbi:hypothetical protein RclHR1_02140025 [Rhizophagus clarus]|uniref:F-box domain-containing protein n=1 Tax=Rhizophagus clarus TaxID=94130 RepID=A0A2Z6QXH8_9GLOM|nr:hypothetical protein RclHR1_02140025 [Rhizophagus clarus]GES84962.1 hypothetical protein GLOIN_2v1784962 [Rhizophagus clarus]